MSDDLIGSLIHSERVETRSLWSRVKWPLLAGIVLVLVGTVAYQFRHHRQEQQVRGFIAAVADGRHADAFAMWEGGESYDMTRFLEDWGEEAYFTTGTDLRVVDSEGTGATVTIYVALREDDPIPTAIRVNRETGLLSFAPVNKYQPTRIFTPR
jgi:hypothetical protein